MHLVKGREQKVLFEGKQEGWSLGENNNKTSVYTVDLKLDWRGGEQNKAVMEPSSKRWAQTAGKDGREREWEEIGKMTHENSGKAWTGVRSCWKEWTTRKNMYIFYNILISRQSRLCPNWLVNHQGTDFFKTIIPEWKKKSGPYQFIAGRHRHQIDALQVSGVGEEGLGAGGQDVVTRRGHLATLRTQTFSHSSHGEQTQGWRKWDDSPQRWCPSPFHRRWNFARRAATI